MINEYLSLAGLRTEPYFENEFIHSTINFVNSEVGAEATSTTTSTTTMFVPVSHVPTDLDEYLYNPTYRIGKLQAANRDLASVNSESDISEAITQMLAYDYSQLPVMHKSKRGLQGISTWKLITISQFAFKNAALKTAHQ